MDHLPPGCIWVWPQLNFCTSSNSTTSQCFWRYSLRGQESSDDQGTQYQTDRRCHCKKCRVLLSLRKPGCLRLLSIRNERGAAPAQNERRSRCHGNTLLSNRSFEGITNYLESLQWPASYGKMCQLWVQSFSTLLVH